MSCSNFSAGVGDRWEELHRLASEPREQHVLMAEQVEDATNGLLSTLSKSAVCTVASPGKAFQAGRSGLAHVEVGWEWFPEARGQEAPQEGGKQEEWGLATLVLGYPALFTSLCQALWAFSAGNLACLWVRGVQALGPRSREALCLSTSSGRRAKSAFWSWSAQGHFSWAGRALHS